MKTYALLRVQFVSYLTLSIFTVATHVAAVEPKEIVGTWRDQHGAITELRGDGTYRSHFADEYGTGTWRLSEGVLLRLQWYLADNKTSGETYRIISFKKDTMRFQGPEGYERWIRQKQKVKWPKELEEVNRGRI